MTPHESMPRTTKSKGTTGHEERDHRHHHQEGGDHDGGHKRIHNPVRNHSWRRGECEFRPQSGGGGLEGWMSEVYLPDRTKGALSIAPYQVSTM
jgi:hypothetical protein